MEKVRDVVRNYYSFSSDGSERYVNALLQNDVFLSVDHTDVSLFFQHVNYLNTV